MTEKTKPIICYEVHGEKGPYLLMLHGILSSRAQWIPNLESLKDFCRPVVVELFGHGRSPSPDDPDVYSPDNYVLEFERIRLKLGVEKWFICGQSLGAALTLRYALLHPERVTAQIFTNSESAITDANWEEGLKALAASIEKEGRSVIDNFPRHPARNKRLDPSIRKAFLKDVDLVDLKGFVNTGLYTVAKCSVRNIIGRNRVPTLLIMGRFDKPFLHYRDFIESSIPHLEIEVLDGGHAVNIDAPLEFNRAVKSFLERFF